MKQLLIESIRIDGGTQSRAEIHAETVSEYVEAIQAGAKMPPLLVFHDGTDYWLAEGFHRLLAYQRAEKRNVLVEIKQGTKEDAAWASAGANVTHGLRRTPADKRKATEMAIRLRPDLSPEAIGQHCGTSTTIATQIKRNLIQVGQIDPPDHRTGVDGKRYPMPPTRPPSTPPTRPPSMPPSMPPTRPLPAPPPPTLGRLNQTFVRLEPEAEAAMEAEARATLPPARRPGPQTGQTDATGHPIPDHLIDLWDRRTEIDELLAHVSKVRCAIKDAQDAGDALFAELNTSATMANLNTVYDCLKATAPHAVCPWCHGTLSDQCRGCKGRGMIGSFAWDRVPKDLKKGRK
jgi:hypothetical protein